MYLEKDSYDRFAIMDMSDEDLEIIRRACLFFKSGLITTKEELNRRYFDIIQRLARIEVVLEDIERVQKEKQQQKQHP